jgi:hypothetical protein
MISVNMNIHEYLNLIPFVQRSSKNYQNFCPHGLKCNLAYSKWARVGASCQGR